MGQSATSQGTYNFLYINIVVARVVCCSNTRMQAVMHATKAVMPFMIKSQFGRIVLVPNIIHDLQAVVATQGRPAPDSPQSQYMASKGMLSIGSIIIFGDSIFLVGLLSFVRAAAMDLAQFGITVNAIEPGLLNPSGIVTAALAIHQPEKPVIPMMRLGRLEEVATPAIFFASDSAGYITGQWISAGGGLGLTVSSTTGSPTMPHGNPSGNGNGNGNGGNGNSPANPHQTTGNSSGSGSDSGGGNGHNGNGHNGNGHHGNGHHGNGNGSGSGSGSDSSGGRSSSRPAVYIFTGNPTGLPSGSRDSASS